MKIILTIILVAMTINSWALTNDAGTTGFTFTKLLFSPRAAALGSAYAGIANDPETVFYNPAGLFQVNDRSFTAVYMNYLMDINCGAVIYVQPVSKNSTSAFYSRFLTTTETRTLSDSQGNYLGTDGTFGAANIELGASYAHHFTSTLNLGINAKMIYESLDSNSAAAIAADLGLYHISTNPKLHLGLVLRNLGFQISSFTESKFDEKLPLIADVGFGYRMNSLILFSADLYKPMKSDYYGRMGLELSPHSQLKLRIGYKTDAADWKKGGDMEALSGFSGGFAILWKNYTVNFAFLSYGDLGLVSQISLNYKF